jgi:hypothetical protein
MSAQGIGDKKRRQAERQTGLALQRVLRLSNHIWEGRVISRRGHWHYRIDPRTWEHWRDDYAMCWSSCDSPRLRSWRWYRDRLGWRIAPRLMRLRVREGTARQQLWWRYEGHVLRLFRQLRLKPRR